MKSINFLLRVFSKKEILRQKKTNVKRLVETTILKQSGNINPNASLIEVVGATEILTSGREIPSTARFFLSESKVQ